VLLYQGSAPHFEAEIVGKFTDRLHQLL
jgi:hypothetical protein